MNWGCVEVRTTCSMQCVAVYGRMLLRMQQRAGMRNGATCGWVHVCVEDAVRTRFDSVKK